MATDDLRTVLRGVLQKHRIVLFTGRGMWCNCRLEGPVMSQEEYQDHIALMQSDAVLVSDWYGRMVAERAWQEGRSQGSYYPGESIVNPCEETT